MKTSALRTQFLAPPVDRPEHPPTIPRPLETPKASEMPGHRRQRREVLPSLPVAGGPADEEDRVERPSEVDGVRVEREQRLVNYQGSFFKISKLFLANKSMVWGCWDCLYVAESRGAVMSHRNAEHGSRYGHKQPKIKFDKRDVDVQLDDVVLSKRDDGSPAPETIMEMTVGEFLAVMPTIRALGDTMERLERENEELKNKVADTQVDRASQHKIDVYETNRAEIMDLRLIKSKHEHCEDHYEEVKELRAFRRKMITRMRQLGFTLSEEEN